MQHGRMRATIVAALITLFALALPANASAALPDAIGTSYTGTAFAIGTASVTGYRWSSTGWVATSFTPGMSFTHVQPYGSGWMWAYRGSAWYALRATQLAPWTCESTGASAAYHVVVGEPLLRYNNYSTKIRNLAQNEEIWPICAGVQDATGSMTTPICGVANCGCFPTLDDACTPVLVIRRYILVWARVNGVWTKAYTDNLIYGYPP